MRISHFDLTQSNHKSKEKETERGEEKRCERKEEEKGTGDGIKWEKGERKHPSGSRDWFRWIFSEGQRIQLAFIDPSVVRLELACASDTSPSTLPFKRISCAKKIRTTEERKEKQEQQ